MLQSADVDLHPRLKGEDTVEACRDFHASTRNMLVAGAVAEELTRNALIAEVSIKFDAARQSIGKASAHTHDGGEGAQIAVGANAGARNEQHIPAAVVGRIATERRDAHQHIKISPHATASVHVETIGTYGAEPLQAFVFEQRQTVLPIEAGTHTDARREVFTESHVDAVGAAFGEDFAERESVGIVHIHVETGLKEPSFLQREAARGNSGNCFAAAGTYIDRIGTNSFSRRTLGESCRTAQRSKEQSDKLVVFHRCEEFRGWNPCRPK